MQIIRERIRPEFDTHNFDVIPKKLNLLVEKYVYYSLGDKYRKWMIRGYELTSGDLVKFEINEENLCRKIKFDGEIMNGIKEGESFQFIWKILIKKGNCYPCNNHRFKLKDRMEIFDGFIKINTSKIPSIHEKHPS